MRCEVRCSFATWSPSLEYAAPARNYTILPLAQSIILQSIVTAKLVVPPLVR
ncbi:unnamed protein product, partial [Mycena citricolor]